MSVIDVCVYHNVFKCVCYKILCGIFPLNTELWTLERSNRTCVAHVLKSMCSMSSIASLVEVFGSAIVQPRSRNTFVNFSVIAMCLKGRTRESFEAINLLKWRSICWHLPQTNNIFVGFFSLPVLLNYLFMWHGMEQWLIQRAVGSFEDCMLTS